MGNSKRRYRSPRQMFSTVMAMVASVSIVMWTLGVVELRPTMRISFEPARIVVGVVLLGILLLAAIWEW